MFSQLQVPPIAHESIQHPPSPRPAAGKSYPVKNSLQNIAVVPHHSQLHRGVVVLLLDVLVAIKHWI